MATFRNAVVVLFLFAAATLSAADLRVQKDPKQLATLYPKTAKLRVLNVWATWCVPCVAEMPDLKAIDETFGSEVALAGVTLDNLLPGSDAKKVGVFLDKHKIAFPNVYYTGSPDQLGDHLDFTGEIPVTIVFDAKGKEVWRHEGRLDRKQTIAQLRALLKPN